MSCELNLTFALRFYNLFVVPILSQGDIMAKPSGLLFSLILLLASTNSIAQTIVWLKVPAGLTVNAFSEKEDLWPPPTVLSDNPAKTDFEQFRKDLGEAIVPLLKEISGLGASGKAWGAKKSDDKILIFVFPYIDSLGPAKAYTGYYLVLPLDSIVESRDGKLAKDIAKAIADHYKTILTKDSSLPKNP